MNVQIQKWGNSLALRIPKAVAIETDVHQGSTVEISMDEGRIVFKLVEERDYDLAELLSGISKHDLHSEVDLGGTVGKEVW